MKEMRIIMIMIFIKSYSKLIKDKNIILEVSLKEYDE